MERREFLEAIGVIASLGAVAIPTMAQDQVRWVGALLVGAITKEFLQDGLKQRGWKLGQNLIIDTEYMMEEASRLVAGFSPRENRISCELVHKASSL